MSGQPADFSGVHAALNGQNPVEAVRRLVVRYGANARDAQGATLLQYVLTSMRLDRGRHREILPALVEMLVAEGVETEVLHHETGEPLLINAIGLDKETEARILLSMGADRQVRDPKTGQAPAGWLVKRYEADAWNARIGATRMLQDCSNPKDVLIVTGSDGKKRLSAGARLMCEYDKLQPLVDALPGYTHMQPGEAVTLVHEVTALMPERHRDKLDVSFLLRDAPLAPGTEVLVEYARGSAKRDARKPGS